MLCKAENFRLGRDADPAFCAAGDRRRPETTTSRIDWRPTLPRVAAFTVAIREKISVPK